MGDSDMKNPTRHMKQKLMRRYGMTEAEYNERLAAQGGRCAICAAYRRLVVDHAHDADAGPDAVRGLLCAQCNAGLGLFREDRAVLVRASEYVATTRQAGSPRPAGRTAP